MDLDLFRDSPIGRLVPISGTHSGKAFDHFAYVPDPLPSQVDLSGEAWALISEAMHALGRLDSAGKRVPNPRLLARPAIRREAVSTSALEGTYTTLPQILESEAAGEESDSRDVDEVLRFVRTAEMAFDMIHERPLTQGMIRELHARLMRDDPRCPEDERGTYRDRQNFIGPRHAGIVDSFFVPPPPGGAVQDSMDDWIQWIHRDGVPLPVRLALGHYQFETIHPFFDGNGRIGRLLAVLQLMEDDKLSVPILEISTYFDDRRDEYQEHLRKTSSTGDFQPWIVFFTEGIRTQSELGVSKIDDLLTLQAEMLHELREARVRGTAVQLAEELIGAPVAVPADVAKRYSISYPAAVNAIERLEEFNMLRRVRPNERRRLYAADRVIEILNR